MPNNVPLSAYILPVSSDDMPTDRPRPWCCDIFPVIANYHWSRSRANFNAWRNFYQVLDTQAVAHLDKHSLLDQPFFARWSDAIHCQYQGPAAPRRYGRFQLAKQKFCFESDRKRVVDYQTIIKQSQHHRP